MACKFLNLEAILAIDTNNGLAKNGIIPWKSKTDLTFFKNKTMGHIVIMGSKTLLSLPKSQPLKGRTNIVVTNEKDKYLKLYDNFTSCVYFLNLEETFKLIDKNKEFRFFVIGGNKIYNILLPYCSSVWVTKIKYNYNCDLSFSYDISTYNKDVVYEDSELEIMYLY